ncbi:MAG: hypothetical protein JWO95_1087 [Verrucomicrobiales bacterium]|nr:hypothetical protein [Verrucomicrobiales bacterium]
MNLITYVFVPFNIRDNQPPEVDLQNARQIESRPNDCALNGTSELPMLTWFLPNPCPWRFPPSYSARCCF